MYKFLPYMTNDFSTGLFCEGVNDIYHSAEGALSEAYEKFILPLDIKNIFSKSNDIKVLDICYGVGYNTKAFLNEIIKKNLSDKKISIDCVDNDEILIKISPFIKSKINFVDRIIYKKKLRKNVDCYSEAKKIIDSPKEVDNKFFIDELVNKILIKNLINEYGYKFLSDDLKKIMTEHENYPFFDRKLINFCKKLANLEVYLYQNKNNSTFVHNIYYKYISKRIISKEYYKDYSNINVQFYSYDIREYINTLSSKYDVVFLDGFTPSKCPCIWSVDFFNKLYSIMNKNSLLVTYNVSAPVRNAMLLSGFYIGNTLNQKNKIIGTIASKNNSFIKHELSDKDKGLLKSKAGIPYRDYNLSLDNDTILLNRKNEVESSDLISSSQYFKQWENNYEK